MKKTSDKKIHNDHHHNNSAQQRQEKKLSCPICLKKYKQKHLKEHLKIHTNIKKPFACPQSGCPFRAHQKVNVRIHLVAAHSSEKPFSCPNCPFKTKTKTALKSHGKTHSQEKSHVCPHTPCQFRTTHANSLKYHLMTHTGEKPHECTLCDFRTSNLSGLNSHIRRRHTLEKYFDCSFDNCQFSSVDPAGLVIHERSHTGSKPYKCDRCGVDFTQKGHLSVHIRSIHLGIKLAKIKGKPVGIFFKCGKCDKKLSTKSSLKSHQKVHDDKRPFACPQCPYTCKWKSTLENHIRFVHATEKPFNCHLCSYKAVRKVSMDLHLRRHTGQKSHKCPQCPFQCWTTGTLNLHRRIHTGEKPYSCPKCEFRACISTSVKRHIARRHNDGDGLLVKKFSCNFCDYSTIDPYALVGHSRTHTGEKPYSCHLCPFSSALATNLSRHEEVTHFMIKGSKCSSCPYKTGDPDNVHSRHRKMCPLWMATRGSKRRSRKSKKLGREECNFFQSCGYSTSDPKLLALHHNRVHGFPFLILKRIIGIE